MILLAIILCLLWRTNFFKRHAADKQKEDTVRYAQEQEQKKRNEKELTRSNMNSPPLAQG